jgi:ubiquinone biosynthesis protein
MLWEALAAARDLGRLRDIAGILIRHGFGEVVRRIGLADALQRAGQALHWGAAAEFASLEPPVRVRQTLEELGPTFVKLGQLLATRMDLFDPEWIAEFSKLQDRAPALAYADIRQLLIEDLGGPPEEVFETFDPVPLAAASIAQVHRARLHDGGDVAVKVRRPGIRPIIEADLRWLARLAEVAGAEIPELNRYRPQEFVRQLAQSLRRELDFAAECRNADRIRENFASFSDPVSGSGPRSQMAAEASFKPSTARPIIIPRVYWQWTGERVCVQEFVDGIPGSDLGAIDRAGFDRKILARRGTRAVLKMIIEDGFFHADPHPGNVFYLPGDRIAFIDFGMVGQLSEARREQLTRLLLGLTRREAERVVDVLLDWSGDGLANEADLTQEVQAFVDQYHGVALKDFRLGAALTDFAALLRAHWLLLPADLALLIKAFISLEGMGRELDPGFDMVGEMTPMIEKLISERYLPDAVLERGWRTVSDLLALAGELPHDLTRQLRAARRGKLSIHIDVAHLQRAAEQIDGAANRLSMSIVVAALIVGSSIVMSLPGNSTLWGPLLLGVLGFVGALIGGLLLLLSIWKSGGANRK